MAKQNLEKKPKPRTKKQNQNSIVEFVSFFLLQRQCFV